MSRCLVLGAGLIGSHVARALADRGHAVTVFSRGFNPWFVPERRRGIDCRTGLIEEDVDALRELVAESDWIVHLASSSRPPTAQEHPLADLKQTVSPALAVMEQALAGRGARVLLASSGGTVYGNPATLPTPEDHPLRPTTPYGISNATLEHYAAFYARTRRLPVTTMRFSNVYGPGQLGTGSQGVIGTWLRRLAAGEAPVVVTDLSVRRDFVYVDDAASAVAALVDSGCAAGAYNIGSGATASLEDVLHAVEAVTGVDLRPTRASSAGTHPTADIPTTLLDTRRIREATGWAPAVSLPEGVRRSWDWVSGETLAAAPRAPQARSGDGVAFESGNRVR